MMSHDDGLAVERFRQLPPQPLPAPLVQIERLERREGFVPGQHPPCDDAMVVQPAFRVRHRPGAFLPARTVEGVVRPHRAAEKANAADDGLTVLKEIDVLAFGGVDLRPLQPFHDAVLVELMVTGHEDDGHCGADHAVEPTDQVAAALHHVAGDDAHVRVGDHGFKVVPGTIPLFQRFL